MNNLGNKETLSKNIKYYLNKQGLNTAELADKLNIKRTTVYDWVKGKTYPRIDKLEMLANFFGINKSDLVEEHDENSSKGLTDAQKQVAYLIDPNATQEEIEQIKQLVEIAKLSKRRL